MGSGVSVQRYWVGFTVENLALIAGISAPELYVLVRPRSCCLLSVLLESEDPVSAWSRLRSRFPSAVQRFVVTRGDLWSVGPPWRRLEESVVFLSGRTESRESALSEPLMERAA